MDIRHDLEQLRKRIGSIEGDLDCARRQLRVLEYKAETAAAFTDREMPSPVRTAAATMPQPRPVATPPPLPLEAYKVAEARFEPAPVRTSASAAGPERDERRTEPAEPSYRQEPGWKSWLQRLQLWPPEDGQNNEVRLGAWWATRLGTVLAVIGVVFFGVYVSLNTPPWVKFAELFAICGGVAAAGLWLEKRIPRFGAVVFAGGLALVYFCAYAGYALPAVKVLTSPVAAAGWQLAAVGLIAVASIGRRSPSIATMAVGLGYMTAIFSRAGGLHGFALVTAAMLAVAAVGFYRRLRWEGPSVVALPGAYAVYALALHGTWRTADAPPLVSAWLYLGGMAVLFFARDWRNLKVACAQVTTGERWFQGTNSTLAAGLGVITALALQREELAGFYFAAAAVLGMFAALRRAQVEDDAISAVFLAKAAGALTLGVIEAVDGRTTALALLVQAWVMVFSAKRLKSRVLAAGAGVVALVATVYFFDDAAAAMPLISWKAAGAFAFVGGIAWLAAEGRRSFSKEMREATMTLDVAGVLIATAAAVVTVHQVRPDGWEPALLAGVAAALALGTRVRRGVAPMAAAACLMAVANVSLWALVESPAMRGSWVANSLAVLVPCAAISAWLGSGWLRTRMADNRLSAYGALVGTVTLAGLAHLMFALAAPVVALAIMSTVALALGVATAVWSGRHLPWLATIGGILGFVFWREGGAAVSSPGALLAALTGAWALPLVLHGSKRHAVALAGEPAARWLVGLQMAVAVLIAVEALPFWFVDANGLVAFGLTALAAFGLTRWPGIACGLQSSWAMWAVVIWNLANPLFTGYSFRGYDTRLVLVALMAWAPAVVLSRATPAPAVGWRRRAPGVQTVLATVLAWVVCVRCFGEADLCLALVAAVAAAVCAHRWGRVAAARPAAGVLSVAALCAAWGLVMEGRAEGWGEGLVSVVVTAGGLVALPLATGFAGKGRWAFGVAGLALAFYAALAQRGTLDPYATVGWGLAAIAVFMTGVFARVRPYRMLGLIGLALCVGRVFLVDLDSALHRIVAFVVLGLVLLWVGFSYHRFRHLIADEPGGNENISQ